MKDSIYFLLIFHFHQPLGNFSWVIEHAYEKAYLPLLKTIKKFPKLKLCLHFSGPLLNYLFKNHPDYLEEISNLVNHNQIEIIGGGFFEPIFAIIPKMDQIKHQ